MRWSWTEIFSAAVGLAEGARISGGVAIEVVVDECSSPLYSRRWYARHGVEKNSDPGFCARLLPTVALLCLSGSEYLSGPASDAYAA